jgi:deoxyribodipyrimidine photo-lyase
LTQSSRPDRIGAQVKLDSLAIPVSPTHELEALFPPGESAALKRLDRFIRGVDAQIYRYGEDRNRPDLQGTSTISPYLRFGILSPRRAGIAAIRAAANAPNEEGRKSADTWLSELIWREFYIDILYHFPQVRGRSFKPDLDNIHWSNDRQEFEAWCAGLTGYPIVDAAMRQLAETGWMHNRARMIVASFLVKDLLIDWRWGERWFMQHLLDGDPASNNGGWQWTAGTGTDAAPYFRIFNPILQGKKSDPKGGYVRRWLPELNELPNRYVHEPWSMPEEVQADARCTIEHDYPAPIVEHSWARERTLAAYQSARDAGAPSSR